MNFFFSLTVGYALGVQESSSFLFVTPHDGWVTGMWLNAQVYLYATHDGGKTWKPTAIAPVKRLRIAISHRAMVPIGKIVKQGHSM